MGKLRQKIRSKLGLPNPKTSYKRKTATRIQQVQTTSTRGCCGRGR